MFWFVFTGGIAIGFLLAILILVMFMIFSLAKTSGRDTVEEEEDQLRQGKEIERRQQGQNKKVKLRLVR